MPITETPAFGKWDGSTWTRINIASPITMSVSGSILYANYGGALWEWDGSTWTQINTAAPINMVGGI